MQNIDLSDQRILITGGAGSGIGSGLCEALHGAGAILVINDIDKAGLRSIAEKYPSALTVCADIQNPEEVDQMFTEIEKFCGGVNGLVNNAGIGLSKFAHDVSEPEFARLFGIDVAAVWRLSKSFVNQCLKAKSTGNIVNISSIHVSGSMARYAIYCSAKNAVVGLTKGMACELGPLGFRVNAVGPGYVHASQNFDLIKTWSNDPDQWVKDYIENQQVLNFEIQPVDVGNMVAFLLSDLAKCITGQNIYVDNGTTSMIFNRDFT